MRSGLKPEIQEELYYIVQKIVATVATEEIYLFGSFARDENRDDSDYDLFVVLSDEEERTILCRQRIAFALCDFETRELDILATHCSKYYNEDTRGVMADVVFREGVKLYGEEKFYFARMA